MKIAIVNDIHVGKDLEHNGLVRASSHLIEARLQQLLEDIVLLHSPDLFINLGDLIRSETESRDIDNYSRLISFFRSLHTPVIHLIGNHEIKKMPLEEVEKVWFSQGFLQKSFGSICIQDVDIVWLGLSLDSQDPSIGFLPDCQLEWLRKTLKSSIRRTLIFVHFATDDHNTAGNFFYEAMDNHSKKALFLRNHDALRSVISEAPHVKGVLQAHLHYFHVNILDDIPYITCPALGDNICGPDVKDNIPNIYTILSIDSTELCVKAYSGKFCFSGYQQLS